MLFYLSYFVVEHSKYISDNLGYKNVNRNSTHQGQNEMRVSTQVGYLQKRVLANLTYIHFKNKSFSD